MARFTLTILGNSLYRDRIVRYFITQWIQTSYSRYNLLSRLYNILCLPSSILAHFTCSRPDSSLNYIITTFPNHGSTWCSLNLLDDIDLLWEVKSNEMEYETFPHCWRYWVCRKLLVCYLQEQIGRCKTISLQVQSVLHVRCTIIAGSWQSGLSRMWGRVWRCLPMITFY